MASTTIPIIFSGKPLIEKITVELGDFTTNTNGNYAIPSNKIPNVPSGYTLLTAKISAYSNATSSPHVAITCNSIGTYIYGPASASIKAALMEYIYILTSQLTTS